MMNWYEVKRVISSVNVSISVTANNEGLICYSAASLPIGTDVLLIMEIKMSRYSSQTE
jgi:hypothetical protein